VIVRGILAAVLTMALYVGVQALWFHAARVRRKLAVMLRLWVGGLGVYALVWAALPDDPAWLPPTLAAASDPVNWLNGLFLYWGLFAGYYQFVNMADNSVGVRSLIEIDRAGVDELTLAGLERFYPQAPMLGHRLDRLVAGGFLARDADGRYRCTRKGAWTARVFARLKGLLGLGAGG
jgi:hypothetical protein